MAVEEPAASDSPKPEGQPFAAPSAADMIIPALAVALVAYYSATTLGLTWEAKVTGVVIGVVLVPLCLVQIARLATAIASGHGRFGFGDLLRNDPFNRQRLALVAAVAAFITGLDWIGTTGGLFLLSAACMLIMGVRDMRALLGIAFGTAAVVYVLLIYLLNSRLPRGPVETLIGSILGG